MSPLSFFSRRFLENPHVGRQLARFSPFALGFILFFIAGGLLLADFIVFRNVFLEDSTWLPEGSAGSMLHLTNALLLYGFLAILLPMRLAGAIDGARADRSFDQIVVTGWSPLSLHLGNWGLGLGYAAVILAVSLPFQAFAYTLGGVTPGEIATAYLVLIAYANVIIAVTLALGIGERERVVVPTSIFIFLAAGMACLFSGAGGALGEATPVRFLLRQGDAGVHLLGPRIFPLAAAYGPVTVFSWNVPVDAYQLLLWGLIIFSAATVIVLGPSHRFTPGLNNFGAIALPGDRWRRLFRRQSLALTRKVELAFFYENRPAWLDGWDFIARKLPVFAWLWLIWGVIQGAAFRGAPAIDPAGRFHRDPAFLLSITGTAVVAFLALIALGDTRHRAGVRERVGPWELPRGILLSACAAAVLAGFVALHAWTFRSAIESTSAAAAPVAAAAADPGDAPGEDEAAARAEAAGRFERDWGRFLAALALLLANCHLIGKVIALAVPSMHAFGISLLAVACGLLLGPYFIWLGVGEGWLPSALHPLVFLTPTILPAMEGVENAAALAELGFAPEDVFRWLVILHVGLALAVLALLATLGLRRKRAARPEPRTAPAAATVAILLLVAIPAAPAAAAEPLPIEVRVTRGFEGRLLGEGVDFFTVVLRSSSPRTIRGTLRLQAGDPPEDVSAPRPFEAPASTAVVLRWSEASPPGIGFPADRLLLEAREGTAGVDLPDVVVAAGQGGRGMPRDVVHLIASEGGGLPGLVRSGHTWVASKPFSLPEDPRAYEGASTVFIGPTDLSALTRGQRNALADYIRLGGSVILYGPIDRASLLGAPEWAALIGGKPAPRVVRSGMELAVEEIDEGAVVWRLEGENGEPAVPLLTVRALGMGRLGHLAFDLVSGPEVLGPRTGGIAEFWSAFDSRVPRSAYPAAVMVPSSWGAMLLDPGPLLAVVIYFVLYMLFLGPVLAFCFRRKSRRRRVVPYIAVVSILFVAGIPLLGITLHWKPSYAGITRAACFGPGARRGVVQASIGVRSSGRQRHRLRIEGEEPAAFDSLSDPWRSWSGAPALFLSNQPGRFDGALDLDLPPWGSRRMLIAADASRAEPVTGRVVIEGGRGSLRARGLAQPVDGWPLRGRLFLLEVSGAESRAVDLETATFSRGEVTMDFPVGGLSSMPPDVHSFSLQHGVPGSLILGSGSGPRAILAFLANDVPLSVESSDLLFEREVEPPDEKKGARRRSGPPLIERDGRHYRSFQGTVILQELELEIR